MQLIDYILNDIEPLTLRNTISDAKKVFATGLFSHIPVVEEKNLYGLFVEEDLSTIDDDTLSLGKLQHLLLNFHTSDQVNGIDLVSTFAINEANIIPVLNEEKEYIGYYELLDVLYLFNATPFFNETGAVVIVAKDKTHFSMSEIAQIVESNGAKLLGMFVSKDEDNQAAVTLKIYSENINDIIHSFRRYDYEIILGVNEDEYLTGLKERSDYLNKYLSI